MWGRPSLVVMTEQQDTPSRLHCIDSCDRSLEMQSPGTMTGDTYRALWASIIRLLAYRFMVGTEQGSLLLCNRKAKTAADRVGAAFPGDETLAQKPYSLPTTALHARARSLRHLDTMKVGVPPSGCLFAQQAPA